VSVEIDRRAAALLPGARRWLIKFGSSIVTGDGAGLHAQRIEKWCDDCAAGIRAGREIVIVSSGAVAEGMARCSIRLRPQDLSKLQAIAAIGQLGLSQAYEKAFSRHRLPAAQVLLSHDDLADRKRYLNVRNTLRTLLEMGVTPIINENDSVATEEIRLGDNDTLAALVTNLIEAEVMVLMTDQAGLHERDPRHFPDAPLVLAARADAPHLQQFAGQGRGEYGRGGMSTKLRAARLAALGGASTIICDGRHSQVLQRLFQGECHGTWLWTDQPRVTARKQWLAGRPNVKGSLKLDEGAAKALLAGGCSLLPVGVTAVEGSFERGDLIVCHDEKGRQEIARGLVNYSSEEARRILGIKSDRIVEVLGYSGEPEMVHRDNLILCVP